jgi:streptomycin 6-kinase
MCSVASQDDLRSLTRSRPEPDQSKANAAHPAHAAYQNRHVAFVIPSRLVAACSTAPERTAWLTRLPDAIRDLQRRWTLTLEQPFDGDDVSCAWVAAATLPTGTPVVLKLGMPHMEAEDEIAGLRFWNGDPTVRLLDADDDLGAMLLERCEPGTPLRSLPESDQHIVIANLLRRLWRGPSTAYPFRPLAMMLEYWSAEALAHGSDGMDIGLVRDGVGLFRELAVPTADDVLLATDLHAGNVLRAEREPWLAIDPKPFIGDPAYDVTQHLLNCQSCLLSDPHHTIERVADLAGVDRHRAQLWLFARAATAVDNESLRDLARRLAP